MNPQKGTPACYLDQPSWYKMHRIIWSIDGISPCVTAGGGGNIEPKILIEEATQ